MNSIINNYNIGREEESSSYRRIESSISESSRIESSYDDYRGIFS